MIFYSNQKITPKTELFNNYVNINLSYEEKNDILEAQYKFRCKCLNESNNFSNYTNDIRRKFQYLINSKNGKLNIIEGKNISEPKAIILNIHGVGAHFQSVYDNLDEFVLRDNWFSKFNFKSMAFEFYGHCKSEGTIYMINNLDDLIEDLDTVIKHLNEKFNNKKIFICVESMEDQLLSNIFFKKHI